MIMKFSKQKRGDRVVIIVIDIMDKKTVKNVISRQHISLSFVWSDLVISGLFNHFLYTYVHIYTTHELVWFRHSSLRDNYEFDTNHTFIYIRRCGLASRTFATITSSKRLLSALITVRVKYCHYTPNFSFFYYVFN